MIRGRHALVVAAAVLLASAALVVQGQVVCDGTGLKIQDGLFGVSGATLQSRTPIAASGPNLILNGE